MTLERRHEAVDAVVIGGGFYGCVIGLQLKRVLGLRNVTIVERGSRLLDRASYANQARIHNGYHYPRSFTTAFRSRINFSRFVARYQQCIDDQFTMLYGIARQNSHVTARQFERFCRAIGAPCVPADRDANRLFSTGTIESVFQVEEFAFNAVRLASYLRDEIDASDVIVRTKSEVFAVRRSPSGIVAEVRAGDEVYELETQLLFNCTYARLHRVASQFGRLRSSLKFEIAEIALIDVPDELRRCGVTVMDGPFFSLMPFPARGQHSLSHVRYTPHISWTSEEMPGLDPYEMLTKSEVRSRFGFMQRDAVRFLPLLKEAKYRDSLFEVKVVLMSTETDDARPILIERHDSGIYSILGGKLNNVFDTFDVLENLKEATW